MKNILIISTTRLLLMHVAEQVRQHCSARSELTADSLGMAGAHACLQYECPHVVNFSDL